MSSHLPRRAKLSLALVFLTVTAKLAYTALAW